VPYDDLPVRLPEDLVPDGSGNPLTKHTAFLNCSCPKCGKPAQRETDTMDTFVDSSWYFMRYCSPDNTQAMVDERTNYWMPMDQYIGGIEHAILHLLYARFWSKVMRDMGLVKFDEPFTKLLCQGMVLNHIYQRKNEKGGIDYFWPDEVENIYGEDGRISGAKRKSDGLLIDYDGVGTMSKSKNNGVDPQSLIDRYGADTARLFVMFASPPEQTLEWSDAGVEGAHRFLRRVWAFGWLHQTTLRAGQALAPSTPLSPMAAKLRLEIHSILKQADYDYQRMQYNTVVSAAMKMLNALESAPGDDTSSDAVRSEGFGILLRVLYPVVPHITYRLWKELGLNSTMGDLLDAPWPQVDPSALIQDSIELMLQINGKLRGSLTVTAQADKAAIETQALAHETVIRMAAGAAPKKIVVVPGRLVNVVL
jgi:leucyl-tRNA synthetase